ncbi:glucokinase [Halolactibacillus miurensis]|uniref:Glucokinase n=1 Tax=Halolactibacillus miurensis TaxID=306541 RepID=A0A1I6NYT5_9BACI|nr:MULTISPECIES: ROK family protein [Halolactibacillus]GEM04785.1 glucokinase [Halolactibacillus miurensis]SFS33101.1 glucokinase [Halolactibacillus miurensis]
MYAVGIDIGGTKTALAIVDQSGKILSRTKLVTDTSIDPSRMIKSIIETVKQMLVDHDIKEEMLAGIGIGAPGPLDISCGMITYPPNLPLWRNVSIVADFKKQFNVPVRLENDASAAAVAEHHLGNGRGHKDILYVTISTGIGAGIISNNQLLSGNKGNAGDIGHMVVDPSFGECTCGQLGCFEHVCSGTAISREASKIKGITISTAEAFSLYKEKDEEITRYLDVVINRMGMAVTAMINTLDPEIIVIGGGVSQAGETLFQPIRDYVKQFTLNRDASDTPIVPAELNQEAGVIGAALLMFE